jgi:hypothetical protein
MSIAYAILGGLAGYVLAFTTFLVFRWAERTFLTEPPAAPAPGPEVRKAA